MHGKLTFDPSNEDDPTEGTHMVDRKIVRIEARRALVAAALSYAASEHGEITSPYYDAELELKEEILDKAAHDYAAVSE